MDRFSWKPDGPKESKRFNPKYWSKKPPVAKPCADGGCECDTMSGEEFGRECVERMKSQAEQLVPIIADTPQSKAVMARLMIGISFN